MTRYLNQVEEIMRQVIGKQNLNDPASSTSKLRSYINDAINLTMSDDVKIFENYGKLVFTIDDTHANGVWTLDQIGATGNYTNYSMEAFISLNDPADGSTVWNYLLVYQDPGEFFNYWGVNNFNILIPGMPTDMLYYGTEFTFRTIPDTEYTVTIFAYKQMQDFAQDGNPAIPQDYWLRYLAYLAAYNYVRDYRFDPAQIEAVRQGYSRERKLLLTRTHNQVKLSRAAPRF